jgi:tRNA(Ile2) C34 agmatinyltransferase TiaS
MANLGWARCTDNVADVLRRGAWYPIVEQSADGHLVVEVRGRGVRLARADLSVREDPPDRWSIVVRTGGHLPTLDGRSLDGRSRDLVSTYAVCPHCHERRDFAGTPPSLPCTRCGATSPVDWSGMC